MKHPHYIFGTHAALAALENPMRKVRRVLATKQAIDELGAKLASAQIMDAKKLEAMLPPGSVHQGVAVECEPIHQPGLHDFLSREENKPVLVLDQVTDPHNVGAIMRSAAAFDMGAVIATDRHAPTETGVMAKTASGAMEMLPYIMVGNLVQALESLKKAGYWTYGMDGTAKKALHEIKLDAKTALVMGAEGKGLRRLTAEHCDMLVRLPMSDKMESLNVSNAAAIAMYELFKALK